MLLCARCQKAYGVETKDLTGLGRGEGERQVTGSSGQEPSVDLTESCSGVRDNDLEAEDCKSDFSTEHGAISCGTHKDTTDQTPPDPQSLHLTTARQTLEPEAAALPSSQSNSISHSSATTDPAIVTLRGDCEGNHQKQCSESVPKRIKLEPQTLKPATPTLENTTPTLSAAIPTLENATPTLGAAIPTLENATPTLGAVMPTLENATPTLGAAIPTLENATPTLGAAMPTLENATPTLKVPAPPLPPTVCPPLCGACLGLLDNVFIQNLVKLIAEKLNEAEYVGVDLFCLAITTPLSLLIRETAMYACLKKQFGDAKIVTPEDNFVKEVLRAELRGLLDEELSPLRYSSESPLQIMVKIGHVSSFEECKTLVGLASPGALAPRKNRGRRTKRKVEMNLSLVKKALEDTNLEEFEEFLPTTTVKCSCQVKCLHRPLYVAGRYNKFSRTLPQTPWVVEGVKKVETSIQELICDQLLQVIPATETKFSASGREDVDVRMLGSGRPFLIEIINPRKVVVSDTELSQLQAAINSSTDAIGVQHLKVVSKEAAKLLKEGEEEKRKLYSAIIWTSKEIAPEQLLFLSELKNIQIEQKTPIRVLHRRTLATRVRTICSLQAKFIDTHHFQLLLSTQAGTYVKEFVHGDFGRTQPNLCQLMKQDVDILLLDVEEVELEWPPG